MDNNLSTGINSATSSSPKYKNKSIKVKTFLNNSFNSLVTGVKKSFNKPNRNDGSVKRDQSNEKSAFNQTDDETNDYTKIDVKNQLLKGKYVSKIFYLQLHEIKIKI